MKSKLHLLTMLLLLVLVAPACRKDKSTDPEEQETSHFVSVSSSGSFTKSQLQTFATLAGYGNFSAAILYDVDFYKLVYNTTYQGQTIQASGLLAIPKGVSGSPSLLSAQHGTMFLDSEAPSNFPQTFSGFEHFASAGFITVIPDYIGYGVSKDIVHPYYDADLSALAVVDMLKAAKEYLEDKSIAYSNRTFLAGYSEGGYVTMAAEKEIETNSSHNLSLTAVAAGAGGYDLATMMSAVGVSTTYSEPSFLALVLQSYNTTYGWNRPMTDFFNQPYAGRISDLLNGTKSKDEINAQLSTTPSVLFNSSFYSALSNASAEITFKAALAKNSFPNWYPKTPTRMYHGTADQAVPYQTSQTTYARFVSAGATNVTLMPITNGTHTTSIQPMMLDALTWMKSLDK